MVTSIFREEKVKNYHMKYTYRYLNDLRWKFLEFNFVKIVYLLFI